MRHSQETSRTEGSEGIEKTGCRRGVWVIGSPPGPQIDTLWRPPLAAIEQPSPSGSWLQPLSFHAHLDNRHENINIDSLVWKERIF